MKEQSSAALKTGGRMGSVLKSLLYRHCLFLSVLPWIIMFYISGSLRCCYNYPQAITSHCTWSVWEPALRKAIPTMGAVALHAGWISIAGGLTVLECSDCCVIKLKEPACWSSINKALDFFTFHPPYLFEHKIYLSSHPCALGLMWSVFHSVHLDGFCRWSFSHSSFFNTKMSLFILGTNSA